MSGRESLTAPPFTLASDLKLSSLQSFLVFPNLYLHSLVLVTVDAPQLRFCSK